MSAAVTRLVRQGLILRVDDAGGSGTPVVFQHGLCGDSNQTREAFPSDPTFRRITLECRGHGRSEAGDPKDFSIATFTDDVVSLIENLDVGPVIVGGISMGAAISLRLAVKRPDLVQGLILARPAWVTTSTPPNLEPNALVGAMLTQYPPEEARQIFMRSDIARRLSQVAPDNLKSLEGFFLRQPYEVTAALLKKISADGPGVDDSEVRALTAPTLVIGHEQDFIHPISYARALTDLIPSATLKTITSKVVSRDLYVSDFHDAITHFLRSIWNA
jgi:pimeloyl-ACP methyl ester carboxylesterase